MSDHMWEFTIVVIGFLLSGIGALLGMNLQSIKKCMKNLFNQIDKQDIAIRIVAEKNEAMARAIANCKVDCTRTFVTGEVFLREVGFMRRSLETQTASLNRMEGQFAITEKLPAIVGEISRNIVSEMKKKD